MGVSPSSPWGSPATSSTPAPWNGEGNPAEDPPEHLGVVFTSTGSPEGSFASKAEGTEGWATLVWTKCDNSFCSSLVQPQSGMHSLMGSSYHPLPQSLQLAISINSGISKGFSEPSSHLQTATPSTCEDHSSSSPTL